MERIDQQKILSTARLHTESSSKQGDSTQQTATNRQQSQANSSGLINHYSVCQLFDQMFGLYDVIWEKRYGSSALDEDGQMTEPAKTWMRLLRYAGVTPEMMGRGFAALLKDPPQYPPNASAFIRLCVGDAVSAAQANQGKTKPRHALPNQKRVTSRGIEAIRELQRMTGAKPATEITKGEG